MLCKGFASKWMGISRASGGVKSKLSIDDGGGEEKRLEGGEVFLLRSIILDEALRALPKRVSVSFLHARIERSADIGELLFSVVSLLDRGWLKLNNCRYRSLTLILTISQNSFLQYQISTIDYVMLCKII